MYTHSGSTCQVLCARPVINVSLPTEQTVKNGLLETIIDPLLVGKINPNSLRNMERHSRNVPKKVYR
ncbi:hypothetical protein Leryth_026917 [Lithospermum erythrorhizon]|nr:hypothetical protein Leryth_026917 [Lithospermum erythrorhizon]